MKEASKAGSIAAKWYMLSKGLAEGDHATRLKAELATVASSAAHNERMPAIRALVELGMIDACGGCRLSKYESPTPLMECGACKSVKYCSSACQTADWNRHRSECKGK